MFLFNLGYYINIEIIERRWNLMNFKAKHLRLIYEWLMSILAIISILTIILDYAKMISINKDPYMMVDNLDRKSVV